MSTAKFSVNIEGDYVDSYIYSGLLILVDIEYRLSIYRWDELIGIGLNGVAPLNALQLRELMSDSRKPIPKNSLSELVISKESLKSSKLYSHEVGVWPSDINVYSNKLYISSENGVFRLDLDYLTGELCNQVKIFGEMCFSISPNSFGRLAIAAGKEGVFTLIPMSKFHSENNVKQILSDVCIDLDWQYTKLLAKINDGVIEATYPHMPSQESFDDKKEFFKAVKDYKKTPPKIRKDLSIQASWIAGDKLYSLGHDARIKVLSLQNHNIEFESTALPYVQVLRARTAAFGTIIETDDELIGLIGTQKLHLADEPVSWRAFPRAKNYANQLHVIHEDRLEITIIESSPCNNYGFDTEKIDQIDYMNVRYNK